MIKPTSIFATFLSALVIAGALAALFPESAAAQTAKKLKCTGCVKSKQIQNNGIKSADIKDGQVTTADLANQAVAGANVIDDSLTSLDLAAGSVAASEVAANSIPANGPLE